jgi:hypothetical protein
MHPKIHFIVGVLFIILLYFLFPQISFLNLFIILSSNVLIDGDHYFYYSFKKKDLNPIRCYKWYLENIKRTVSLSMDERKKIYSGFYLFHGIEWIIILLLFGIYFFPILSYVGIGFLLHFLVDTPSEFYFKGTKDKSSLIYNYYRFRKLKSLGKI